MIHYYVIDIETTGLKPGFHEICQISIVRCTDRKQLGKFVRCEHPWRANPQSLAITGRTKEDLKQGISKEDVVDICNKFLLEDGQTPEARCMIAHNAAFDRPRVHLLWSEMKQSFPASLWLCSQKCAREYITKHLGIAKSSMKLHNAMETCGIKPRTGAHNAISDTQNTYILMEHLKKQGLDVLPFIKRVPHGELVKESNADDEDNE